MKTWSERIIELEATGLSLTEIADRIEASLSSVSEIKQGRSKQPCGMAAVNLHALHKERVKEKPRKKRAA